MASVLITEGFMDELRFGNFGGKNDRIKYGRVEYRDISCSLLEETSYWSAQASPGIKYTTYMHTYMHYTYTNNKKQ